MLGGRQGGHDGSSEEAILHVDVPQGMTYGVHQVAPHLSQVNTATLPHLELQHGHGT